MGDHDDRVTEGIDPEQIERLVEGVERMAAAMSAIGVNLLGVVETMEQIVDLMQVDDPRGKKEPPKPLRRE